MDDALSRDYLACRSSVAAHGVAKDIPHLAFDIVEEVEVAFRTACSQTVALVQKASAEERLTFSLLRPGLTPASSKVIRVDYDRKDADEQLLELFRRSGCKRAAAVSIPDYPVPRAEVFLENVRKTGKNIAGDGKFCLDREEKNPAKKLKKMLSEWKPDFVFCDFTDMIEYLYEAALSLDLKIGKDVIFCGIGSGLAFQGMFPRMSYFKIPRYEIGRQIVIQAEKAIREHRMTVQMPRFQVKFIEKK